MNSLYYRYGKRQQLKSQGDHKEKAKTNINTNNNSAPDTKSASVQIDINGNIIKSEKPYEHCAIDMNNVNKNSASNCDLKLTLAEKQTSSVHDKDIESNKDNKCLEDTKGRSCSSMIAAMSTYFDLSLLRNVAFAMYCVGLALAHCNHITTFIFIPLRVAAIGISTSQTALLLSAFGEYKAMRRKMVKPNECMIRKT